MFDVRGLCAVKAWLRLWHGVCFFQGQPPCRTSNNFWTKSPGSPPRRRRCGQRSLPSGKGTRRWGKGLPPSALRLPDCASFAKTWTQGILAGCWAHPRCHFCQARRQAPLPAQWRRAVLDRFAGVWVHLRRRWGVVWQDDAAPEPWGPRLARCPGIWVCRCRQAHRPGSGEYQSP